MSSEPRLSDATLAEPATGTGEVPATVRWPAALAGGLGLAALVWLAADVGPWVSGLATQTAERLQTWGAWGAVAFVGVGVLWVVLFLPLSLLFLLLGVLYGPWTGTLIGWLANALGGLAAFAISRTLLRRRLLPRLERSARFRALDRAVASEGLQAALLLRAGPLPGWLLNYGLGASSVGWRQYVISSIALVPITWLFVAGGAAVGDLGGLAAGRPTGPAYWSVLGAGIMATGYMLWHIRNKAARLLDTERRFGPGPPSTVEDSRTVEG